jgi:hypothetical protein
VNARACSGLAICPLPRLDGLEPRITTIDAGAIELTYPGRPTAPCFVPVFAAANGVIDHSDRLPSGATLQLKHPGGWATRYTELQHLLTRPQIGRRKVRVLAGDVLGHVRRSDLRLRFTMFRMTEDGWIEVDATEPAHAWSLLPWFTEPEPISPAPTPPAARGDPSLRSDIEPGGAALDRTTRSERAVQVRS